MNERSATLRNDALL